MLIPRMCATGTRGKRQELVGQLYEGNMIVFTEVISSCVLTTVFLAQLPIFILPCSSVMFPYNHISSLPVKTALPNPSGCKAVTGGGFKQLV